MDSDETVEQKMQRLIQMVTWCALLLVVLVAVGVLSLLELKDLASFP